MKLPLREELGSLALIVGLVLPVLWFREQEALFSGKSENLILLIISLGPVALLATFIVTRFLTNAIEFKSMLVGFLNGLEIGYIFCAASVLIDWYSNPSNGHLEPLFVVYSTGIATLHWAKKMWSTLEHEESGV